MAVYSRNPMPEIRKAFCCRSSPSLTRRYKIMITVANRIDVTKTWGTIFSNIINRKKMITPRFTNQNPMFFIHKTDLPLSFIKLNSNDMVISESGNENPRKKVSSCSFGKLLSIKKYSLFNITRLDITSPMERHNKEA